MAGPTYCVFANTQFSRGFDFTFSPGVQPSVCMLYTVPHVSFLPNVGTLAFVTDGESPFYFRDCLLESPQLSYGDGGQIWLLPVKDRRWKWQFGYIHGSYNVRQPDGTYLRERSPQQLASLLLDALGETGYDVSLLPNSTRPEASWNGASPAAELDYLCASLGTLVVLNPASDAVEIWPVGSGRTLPSGYLRGGLYAPVYPAQPDSVRVEAGPTLFQGMFELEAVGLDTDDKWKPIDELSYKPAGGWGFAFPPTGFPTVTGSYTIHGKELKKRDLAEATVYRCYRITGMRHGDWVPPLLAGGPFQPSSLKDFRLFDELVDEEISTADGGLRPLPAVVYARYWRENKSLPDEPIRYVDGYSLDAEHGIITFDQPLFLYSTETAGTVIPAAVIFECAFHAGANGLFHRQAVDRSTGSSISTPDRLIQRPELAARVFYRYSLEDHSFTTEQDLDSVTGKLNFWADAALDEYGLQNGGTIFYQQLMPITPDGLTLQVTWSGGGQRSAKTTVSQAQRHNRYITPPDEYRERLQAKRNEQQLRQLANDTTFRSLSLLPI